MINPEEDILQETDAIVDPSEDPSEEKKEDFERLVTSIINSIDVQERPSREVLVRLWKYMELLWGGITSYYWNSQSAQWRPITYDDLKGLSDTVEFDPSLLNKNVNLIRPYGESLVGVLTTTLPRTKYFPANADKVEDINTAKVSSIIEKRIVSDNFMKIKVIEILVKLFNGGFAAAYNYSHISPEYGVYKKPVEVAKSYETTSLQCSSCGMEISSDKKELKENTENIESGTDEPINEEQSLEEEVPEIEETTCPHCQELNAPLVNKENSLEYENEFKDVPKSRQLIKIYGPLHVKIPVKASCKEEVLWLILEEELHESQAKSMYPEYWDKIHGGDAVADLSLDRYARAQYENMAETGINYVTMRKVWLRPSAYPMIGNKEEYETLLNEYSKGLVAVFAGSEYLFCEESIMDEHWTLSFNPLYNRVYGDPLGKALVPLQEVANEIYQLEVDTFKHSIPQLFADPAVVDFEAYAQSQARAGQLYPLKPGSPGRNIGESFFETRSATLPKEVADLDAKQDRLFQFISGILPPVFGGPSAGSKTLGEYEQSKNQALQRLGIVWTIVNVMYSELMAKAVKAYRKGLLEDEFIVEAQGDGSFINTWIRKADANDGEVGKVEPEVGEEFPVSWSQKKANLLELLNLNQEMITSILFHPENIHELMTYLGMDELYVPGDEQRNLQLGEIAKVIAQSKDLMTQMKRLEEEGVPVDPAMIVPPTVPINMMIDDHEIHSEVIKAFLSSITGQELNDNLPLAYAGISMHLQMHQEIIMQQQMEAEAAAMETASEEVQPSESA